MTKTTKAVAIILSGAVLASCAHKPLTAPCKPGKYASMKTDCDPKPVNFAALQPPTLKDTDG